MAITCVFGATESGKSHYVENIFLKDKKKVVVFDGARCFKSGEIVTPDYPGDDKLLLEKWKRLKRETFRYVFQPARGTDRRPAFDDTVSWALALGRIQGDRVDPSQRVILACDEADRLCKPMHASEKFDYLVNEGRHDNVDSIFICRDPNNLFIDARKNATQIVTFFNPLAKQMPYFKELLGVELAERVSKLEKYHYLTWKDNWEVTITDHKGKITFKQGRK